MPVTSLLDARASAPPSQGTHEGGPGMSFTTHEEIAADGRAGRRNVVAGEGMLVVRKSFTWRGERYKASVTRVSPHHAVCDSEYADLLKPAYERESSPAVLRFL